MEFFGQLADLSFHTHRSVEQRQCSFAVTAGNVSQSANFSRWEVDGINIELLHSYLFTFVKTPGIHRPGRFYTPASDATSQLACKLASRWSTCRCNDGDVLANSAQQPPSVLATLGVSGILLICQLANLSNKITDKASDNIVLPPVTSNITFPF